MRDLKSNIATAHGDVATLSGTTPSTGNICDLRGFDAAALVVQTGTVTDAGATAGFTVKVQESDTTVDGDFTDVSGATLSVTDDADDDQAVGVIGYTGSKRYVRCVSTGTTGTNATVSTQWIKFCAHRTPSGAADANVAAT